MTMTPAKPSSLVKSLAKILLPIGVALGLGITTLYWVKQKVGSRNGDSLQTVQLEEGRVAPDFDLPVFGGGMKKISAIDAKLTLVNFWASWCKSCIVEMPSIVELRKTYRDRGLEIVAINVDERPESILPRLNKQLGIDFPVYLDADGKLSELFNVSAIPLSFVLDKNRKVLFVHGGEFDWNSTDFRARVEKWLSSI